MLGSGKDVHRFGDMYGHSYDRVCAGNGVGNWLTGPLDSRVRVRAGSPVTADRGTRGRRACPELDEAACVRDSVCEPRGRGTYTLIPPVPQVPQTPPAVLISAWHTREIEAQ